MFQVIRWERKRDEDERKAKSDYQNMWMIYSFFKFLSGSMVLKNEASSPRSAGKRRATTQKFGAVAFKDSVSFEDWEECYE